MRTAAAALLLGGLLLTSCGTAAPAPSTSSSQRAPSVGRIAVDTPALRRAKQQAGIATCRPGGGTTQLPAVTLPCLGGGPAVDLAGLKGPLVLNLFAEYCGPCRGEMPYYQRLQRRAGSRLTVLGVDFEDPQPAGALAVARAAGVTYPLLADPAGTLRTPFRVRGLPGIVLVRRDGSVASVQLRAFRSYAELRTAVRRELGVRVPA